MNSKEISELEKLLNEVAYARTKQDAVAPAKRLDFLVSQARGGLDVYTANKLSKAAVHAKAAAGQARDKDRSLMRMRDAWYMFKCGTRDEATDT